MPAVGTVPGDAAGSFGSVVTVEAGHVNVAATGSESSVAANGRRARSCSVWVVVLESFASHQPFATTVAESYAGESVTLVGTT